MPPLQRTKPIEDEVEMDPALLGMNVIKHTQGCKKRINGIDSNTSADESGGYTIVLPDGEEVHMSRVGNAFRADPKPKPKKRERTPSEEELQAMATYADDPDSIFVQVFRFSRRKLNEQAQTYKKAHRNDPIAAAIRREVQRRDREKREAKERSAELRRAGCVKVTSLQSNSAGAES